VSKNQIHSIAAGVQRDAMIVIERSDLRDQLRQDLVAASYRSADAECRNHLAPLGKLCRALHHRTIVPTRLAKSIREALALHQSCIMNIQSGRNVHFVRICNPM
jgi:hypothetical protein